MEAILGFIARAEGPDYGLRVAAYEFRLEPFARALKAAKDRGVDVRIIYDGCPNPPDPKTGKAFPRDENRATAQRMGIKSLCMERVTRHDVKTPPISHHKFIVLTKGGKAAAVLTGSANFSQGGVYGQSNVVHAAEVKRIAAKYSHCWSLLEADTEHAVLKQELAKLNDPHDALPKVGTTCLFSPQPSLAALNWYAKLASEEQGALFMTFAFRMNDLFKNAYRTGAAPLRYALMDKLLGPGVRKEKKQAALDGMLALRKMVENRFAVGNRITTNAFDRWIKEKPLGSTPMCNSSTRNSCCWTR